MWLRLTERKAEAGATQTWREGAGLVALAGVLSESWPCRATGAGERCQPWERGAEGQRAGLGSLLRLEWPCSAVLPAASGIAQGIRARQGWSSS